MTILYSAH